MTEPEANTPDEEYGDDEWITVEIPELEGSAFRFRENEDGEFDVELAIENEPDEDHATWYAKGYLECYVTLMEEFAAFVQGEEGEEYEGDEEDGEAEAPDANEAN